MESHDSDVLDRDALLDRLGGDIGLFEEITGLFIEDCPKLLSQIRSAVSGGDARALEQAAHTLKGCVANFGADAAYQAALRLERIGRAGELDDASSACSNLEAEVGRFQQALQALARELMRP